MQPRSIVPFDKVTKIKKWSTLLVHTVQKAINMKKEKGGQYILEINNK